MIISEITAQRVLNPTSIDLGEFVINPYKGCEFNCVYCYARFTKSVINDPRRWGEYVDARINSPELLEKELLKKKPVRVLLGSTTECFQPAERQYRLTGRILDMLNRNGIYYSILTRSPLIQEYTSVLAQGLCERIYFTVNNYGNDVKRLLEPASPAVYRRLEVILHLQDNGIPVTGYYSPVLPYIFNAREALSELKDIKNIEFEGLNFNLGNIQEVIKSVGSFFPGLCDTYALMRKDLRVYNQVWEEIKSSITEAAREAGRETSIFVHGLDAYFQNKYR
ncbi:MAG: radical SAM protein [Candidatus Omnitrophica bacterium]|nr:radical SAM protein [Candidatus Omnitrophota bacterium]